MARAQQFVVISRPARTIQPPSLGWMFLLAAALFSLALPVIGPLVDHHFSERAHNHDHFYLNGWPIDHDHADVMGALHLHTGPVDRGLGGTTGRSANGMVSLTPVASGLMLAALNAPYHPAPEALRPPSPQSRHGNPLGRSMAGSRKPEGANISPPHRPPIA